MSEQKQKEALAQIVHDELIAWRAEMAEKLHRHPETVFLSITDHVTTLEYRVAQTVINYLEDKQK